MQRFALTLSIGFNHEATDFLNQSYVSWCERMGIQPVLIPTSLNDPIAYARSLGVQGVLLTGGNDIGGSPGNGSVSTVAPERDRVEHALVKAALSADWPILGICRGLQFLNRFFGGSLLTELDRNLPGATMHVAHSHGMKLKHERAQQVTGASGWLVNSFHRHGVTIDRLAPELRVLAISTADSLVEGTIHPSHRIMAVQWHPERPGSTGLLDDRLIGGFLDGKLWSDVGSAP